MLPKMEFQLEVAVGWLAGQVLDRSVRQKMDLQLEQEVEVGQVPCIVQDFDEWMELDSQDEGCALID